MGIIRKVLDILTRRRQLTEELQRERAGLKRDIGDMLRSVRRYDSVAAQIKAATGRQIG